MTAETLRQQDAPGDSTARRVALGAHETIDRAADAAERAERTVRDSAAAADERLRETASEAVDQGRESVERARGYVAEHPLAAVGIAFAAGVVAAALLRR